MTFEVYATRWDDPRIIEELIPARGLEFSMPLSAHGECRFSATVEPGRSFWRPAISPLMSGILIASDQVPVWQGWVIGENESGPRSFDFQAVEWGGFFDRVPTEPYDYRDWNDHAIFRDLITRAVAIRGQDPRITLGTTTGAAKSDRTIEEWDDTTVGAEFASVGSAEGGPEWYFGTAGTLDDPIRQLVLGDRLGHTTAQTMLEFVEDTDDYEPPGAPPSVTLLGDLYPVGTRVRPPGRRGGNVIAKARTRRTDTSATTVTAIGSGEEAAQERSTAVADRLIAAGWPRLTRTTSYRDVINYATLDRHARADLAAAQGIATGYSLVTLDGDPVWQEVPRGSSVRVSLDTDVYGGPRPVEFTTRLLNTTVRVDDDGPAQVQWDVAEVQEV